MEQEKILFYLYFSILFGTILYMVSIISFAYFSKTKRLKIISINAVMASIGYIIGSTGIFLLKDSNFVFFFGSLVYFTKFFFETKMSNSLNYSSKNYLIFHTVNGIIVIILILLPYIKVNNNLIYIFTVILNNISISTGWFLTKNLRILSINNIISILFILVLYQLPYLGILFSFIPYAINSIYITSKEYLNTVKSLEVLNEHKDIIIESKLSQFKDFIYNLINRVEARYPQRKMHSINVTNIAVGISLELNLEDKIIQTIKEGSMIHDIGFIGIDHRKLGKGEEDPEIIKHIWIGRYILENSNIFIKYIPMVLYHHERNDGSGPERLTENIIPLHVKILIVADKFERLINGRDGEKLSISESIKFLKKNTDKYDINIVNALERFVMKKYYY
ncbi:MAG: HD-GYP domain-containing protein [Brevinematia bacterium]